MKIYVDKRRVNIENNVVLGGVKVVKYSNKIQFMRRKSKNIRKWRNDIKIFTKLNKVFYRIYTGRVRWLMIMVSGYTTCHRWCSEIFFFK